MQYRILINSIIADSISALRHYGIMALRHYGITALRHYGITAIDGGLIYKHIKNVEIIVEIIVEIKKIEN
ncbi:hypothetical protein C2G38_2078374 [Gigaspora rosea]|uniref:Uncharacterized protein n=1 Tax=Gigaspora rosea TaxID=44941 RepID=A0A397VQG3_9GLOM|nr:hypothetical protein C2G38_2078374 [Gigaspora rosea]